MDIGHAETEAMLKKLERAINREYRQAKKEIGEKVAKSLAKFEKRDSLLKSMVENGKMTEADYQKWRLNQLVYAKQQKQLGHELAEELTKYNQKARGIANGYMNEIYAINSNFATYEIEHLAKINTSFTLHDKYTVANLLKGDKTLLPTKGIDVSKDIKWNENKLNSAITQGVLQGESIPEIAKRLQSVTDMNKNAAIRNARTMTTCAENRGRIDSYKRAEEMGIKVKKVWLATLDDRTRHSHAAIDGEAREVGKKFSNGCEFPADPAGPPEEVYNCRCTLIAEVNGRDTKVSDLTERNSKLGTQSYDEWKKEHEKSKAPTERKIEYSPRSQKETPKENKYRNLENIGYTREQIDEAQRLLDEHSAGLGSQEIADKEILEHIEKRDTIGKLFIDKSELEEQAWKLEIEQERAKAYADYIRKIGDAKDSLRTGGIYSNYTEQDLKDWGVWPEKFDFREPKFYRKGGMGGNILSFSKSSSGAGMSFLTHGDDGYIGYDISYTLSEMIEMGYHPIAGIISFDVGQSGEAEVLFAKFNRIKRRR